MNKPKIGVMGLTLELYRRNLPALMHGLEKFSGEVNGILSEAVDTVHFPVAWNRETVGKGFRIFEKEKVDGIIIIFLSYSQSLEILPAVRKLKIPLLIWNTQKLLKIDGNFGPQDMFENHGMHGVQDLASVLSREGINFSMIT